MYYVINISQRFFYVDSNSQLKTKQKKKTTIGFIDIHVFITEKEGYYNKYLLNDYLYRIIDLLNPLRMNRDNFLLFPIFYVHVIVNLRFHMLIEKMFDYSRSTY